VCVVRVQGQLYAPPQTAVGKHDCGWLRRSAAGPAQHEFASEASGTGQIAQHFRHLSVVSVQAAEPNVSRLEFVFVCLCVCVSA